jgi:hypothetical protein
MTKRLSQLADELRPYWLRDIPTQVRPTTGGGTVRGGLNKPYATFVVAAADSKAPEAANADYVCDGVADNLQIAAALGSGGCRVLLLDGTYTLAAAVIVPGNVSIVGMGMGVTVLERTGDIFTATGADNVQIADMTLDGGGVSATTVTAWDILRCEFSAAGVTFVTPLGCTVVDCRFDGGGVSASVPEV